MPRKSKEEVIDGIQEKIEYLGLNLDKIPENFKNFEPLEFRISKFYDEKKYRQYRFIDIKDIQILLSPTNRLEDITEKYKQARPLYEYLDKDNEENLLKYTTFLSMVKNMDVEEIQKIEKEQNALNKALPFKVKFQSNYLWQIYYSENTDKYFMLVPTEEIDCSTFFYLLKKQLEKSKGKIFVPINNVNYTSTYLARREFEDLENYLWLFTKDWPSIYEVYNKKDELSIQIIGETNVYEKVKTYYKVELKNKKDANEFFKLVKALFIIQTELPEFFQFETNIDKNGSIEFYFNNQKVEYSYLVEFIREQYKEGIKEEKELESKIRVYTKKLKELQEKVAMQEIEYLSKEKQISTFLECKKTFFGKFKYYFKYSKKNNKKSENLQEENEALNKDESEIQKDSIQREPKKVPIKKVYTIDELIEKYKTLKEQQLKMKNLLMDINALKLKNKNMTKKIENATKYIEEIDNHKRSIFEFWKYSNKDEMSTLPEGEKEEVNVIKKIEKTFDYEEDLEKFGQKLDKIQRENLSKEDTDSLYIATTNLIDILNKVKSNTVLPEEIEQNLKNIKKEGKDTKELGEEEYDIFGNIIDDSTKIRKIKNKKHRELPKNKFSILEVNKNTKQIGYKLTLQAVTQNIVKAINKGIIPENLPVYKAINEGKLKNKDINVFNVNPEDEMNTAIKNDGKEINLYKINIKEGTKGIGFTNIIFYDNQNKTLPVGMDLSTRMIIDTTKMKFKILNVKEFNMINIEDENNDFSNVEVKKVNVCECDIDDDSEQ